MRSVYFSNGTRNEQNLLEDLVIESITIYGQDMYYIPRILIAKDEILGEDRLSQFKNAYPIEMYLESVSGFESQGAFINKFGLMMEQSATLTVARRTWQRLVGKHADATLPNRPAEGDLLYFPLTNGLFEIKFVEHQDPFYQLGKLYVFRLEVELFQYASENIDTGIDTLDAFESLKTFSTDVARSAYGEVLSISVANQGSGYTSVPTVTISGGGGLGATAVATLGIASTAGKVIKVTVTNPGSGYTSVPTVTMSAPTSGVTATATATVHVNIDKPNSYGDNNSFKTEAVNVVFDSGNPFGE